MLIQRRLRPAAAGLIQFGRIEQADAAAEESYLVRRHHAVRMEPPQHLPRIFRALVLRNVHRPDIVCKGSHKPILPCFPSAYHGGRDEVIGGVV